METGVRTPIKVVSAGMDERSVARMTSIFRMVYKGRCEFTQGEGASLGIVDLDGEANAWDNFRQQYPKLPAIVMSESPASVDGASYVAKPAKLDLLWEAIFNLVAGLPPTAGIVSKPGQAEASVSTKATAKIVQPTASTAASAMNTSFETNSAVPRSVARSGLQDDAAHFYNPGDYLLGHLLSALKDSANHQCAIHVQCGENRRLVLLPGKSLAYTNLTDAQLRNFSVVTLKGKFTIEINSVQLAGREDLPVAEIKGLQSMSIEHLIWDLALRTARGRVPEGTNVSTPLYLQCWPNFTRLPPTPHGMRIASLWVGDPRTLDDIAANLGIDRADVYSFYSAAAAIGLAGRARRRVDGLIAPREVANNGTHKRGLLASILRHLTQ